MRNPFKRGKNFAKNQKDDIKDIWRRIRQRDFSGNTGIAVKNSVYQISTTTIEKFGSFIFTVIVARLLMPELFGLYSLALSTILVFTAFSELGVGSVLTRYVSRFLGKGKKGKAFAQIHYFVRIKFFLVFATIIILAVSAKFISETIYQKPIFMALIAGILYIIFLQTISISKAILHAFNSFKEIFYDEILAQLLRIILVPVAVVLSLKYLLPEEQVLFYIFISLAFVYFIVSFFLVRAVRKRYDLLKKDKSEKSKLSNKEKKEANKFFVATIALVLSGVFFGNIDRIMLGRFVAGEFIGFYTAALGLVGGITSLIGFSAAVLFPIFSRIRGKRLERAMKKTRNLLLLLSIGAAIAVAIFAPIIISIVYGAEYSIAANILRLFSVLILFMALVGLYQTYHISQGHPQKVAKLLVIVTILNIILNYVLITSLLQYSQLAAVYGAATATLISTGVYLGGLVIGRRKGSTKRMEENNK